MTKDEALKMVNQVLDDKNHYPDEEIPTLVMDALQACKEALDEEQSDKPTIRSFIEFVIAGTIIFVGMYLMLTVGGTR